MHTHVTRPSQIPDFNSISRNNNIITSNDQELDLMIIDIENRHRTEKSKNSSDFDDVIDENRLYLARELLNLNKNPIMIKSLFLPDEEDVFFNNKDLENVESGVMISDEDIMNKEALPNKIRGNIISF